MDRGTWQVTVHGVTKLYMTENRHTCIVKPMKYLLKAPQFSLNTCGSYLRAQHCIFKCVFHQSDKKQLTSLRLQLPEF